MRRWLWPCLALAVAAAIALWPGAGARRVDAPAPAAPAPRGAAPESARADAGWSGRMVEVDADDGRLAAVPPPIALEPSAVPALAPDASGARVSMLVLQHDGTPWTHGRLQLEIPETPEDAALDPAGRRSIGGAQSFRGFATDGGARLRITDWITDGAGRAELTGIPPGRAFEVRAVDEFRRTGGVHAGVPLAPGEVREAQLRLARQARPLTGRCTDASGAPLERVRVEIPGGPREGLQTDAQGRFATPPLFGEEVAVHCVLRGYVSLRELVPLSGAVPVELVLERARRLTVVLVDERGEPFTLHGLQARDIEGGPEVDTYPEVRDGAHVFESMPRVPVTLEVLGCGPSPTLEVDALAEEVRWNLPRPGELVVEVDTRRTDLPRGLLLDLRLPGSDEPLLEQVMGISQLQIPQRWSLFPGRYVLQFHAWTEPAPPTPYGPPREFEVRAGEVTVVPLAD